MRLPVVLRIFLSPYHSHHPTLTLAPLCLSLSPCLHALSPTPCRPSWLTPVPDCLQSLLSRDPSPLAAALEGPAGHFLVAHGPSSCYQLEMNQIRKRGSGGVIACCTPGSQLISGGPGFERKCNCDTEPFLPSLSCPWPGGRGHGLKIEWGRGRGQRPGPSYSQVCAHPHVPTHTCAHTCMDTQGTSWTFASLPHCRTSHLILPCLHTPTRMPWPRRS